MKFRQLTRFPTKNGWYLATVVCKDGYECDMMEPFLFRLGNGSTSYLKTDKVVIRDHRLSTVDVFRSELKNHIAGCPELKYVYHSIKQT